MVPPDDIPDITDPALEQFWQAQQSMLIRNMLRMVQRFALTDLGVRIIGEKGTGKLHLARLIHRYSPRGEAGFTHVDCGALKLRDSDAAFFGTEDSGTEAHREVRGILESARGGTLFLDRFHALPEKTRRKLATAHEMQHFRRVGGTREIPMDLRFVTSITKHPMYTISGENPRIDTRSTMSPVSINIPPLRERKRDIDPLISLFLRQFQSEFPSDVREVTSDALDHLRYYTWPGNIYELRDVVRHAAARCPEGKLGAHNLPEYIRHEYLRSRGTSKHTEYVR